MKYTKEKLEEAVKESECYADVVRWFNDGVMKHGGVYDHVRNKIEQFSIDTSHFKKVTEKVKNSQRNNKLHYKEVLIKNRLNNKRENALFLRRALIESGREYKCEDCGLKDKWNGKELRLQVDHINGDWLDNTPENLRFLCPNCHSQNKENNNNKGRTTKTSRIYNNEKTKICDCGKHIKNTSDSCKRCASIKRRKIKDRPDLEVLKSEIEKFGFSKTSKKYNVSVATIKRWIYIKVQ